MSGSLYKRFELPVQRAGSDQEKSLFLEWSKELELFLGMFEKSFLRGTAAVEIGIESKLALKINIIPKQFFPLLNLMLFDRLSPLQRLLLEDVARFGLKCVFGVKVVPGRCIYEIYVYESGRTVSSGALRDIPEIQGGFSFYGVDSEGRITGYKELSPEMDSGVAGELLRLLQFDVSPYLRTRGHYYRLDQKRCWQLVKYAYAAKFPPDLVSAVIDHFPAPYFSCLLAKRQYREMIFGYTLGDGFTGIYFSE